MDLKKLLGKSTKWVAGGLAVVVLGVGGLVGVHQWRYSATHVYTDDAYVQGDLTYVRPRVPGTLAEVAVGHNQRVAAGQLLVRIDPRDYEVKVEQSRAELDSARNALIQQRAAVSAARAEVVLAQTRHRQAVSESKRRTELYRQGVVAREQQERYARDAEIAQAQVAAAQEQLRRAEAAIGGIDADIRHREAKLHEAELQLSYCTITAPVAGQVTRKAAEVGNVVQAGQPLMALVPLNGLWVEANFKETQLLHVRAGQAAEVRLDTNPNVVFRGKVDSIMAGTGSALSLLPPENATGNWVKVVQRIPVRVVLDARQAAVLRVGQSAEVTIETGGAQGGGR